MHSTVGISAVHGGEDVKRETSATRIKTGKPSIAVPKKNSV